MADLAGPLGPSPDVGSASAGPGGNAPSSIALNPTAGLGAAMAIPKLEMDLGRAKAMFDSTSKAMNQFHLLRTEMSKLAELGDMVTSEDVIHSAGRLVASGIDASKMASILADAPEGGQALSAWLTQRAAQSAQNEQKLAQVHEQARHQLGLEAMKTLAAHHVVETVATARTASGIPLQAGNPIGGTPNA